MISTYQIVMATACENTIQNQIENIFDVEFKI